MASLTGVIGFVLIADRLTATVDEVTSDDWLAAKVSDQNVSRFWFHKSRYDRR